MNMNTKASKANWIVIAVVMALATMATQSPLFP
jgi:hypothetical protein